MTLTEAMQQLEAMGTAQNRKVYARHGLGDNMFGVSFANLGQIKKQIRIDHALAEQLWYTENLDAQNLATMIADPAAFSSSQADAWLKLVDDYLTCGQLAGLTAASKWNRSKAKKWSKPKKEFTRSAGYTVFACMLKNNPDSLTDTECAEYLETIEQQLQTSANRARYSMNGALIAIGIARPKLRSAAIAAAKRIGKVDVDHGETSCKTPDAAGMIRKAAARTKARSGIKKRASRAG